MLYQTQSRLWRHSHREAKSATAWAQERDEASSCCLGFQDCESVRRIHFESQNSWWFMWTSQGARGGTYEYVQFWIKYNDCLIPLWHIFEIEKEYSSNDTHDVIWIQQTDSKTNIGVAGVNTQAGESARTYLLYSPSPPPSRASLDSLQKRIPYPAEKCGYYDFFPDYSNYTPLFR